MTERSPDRNKNCFDENNFNKIYRRLYHRLINYSNYFTRDESVSEDMVQEVFLKFWEKRSGTENIAVEGLLFKMLRNKCLNHLKQSRLIRNKVTDLQELSRWEELYRIDFLRDDPLTLIEQELEIQINGILQNLPDRCRMVFIMSRINGLKNREISEILNISVKTVEKHISTAIRSFRNEIPALLAIQTLLLLFSQF